MKDLREQPINQKQVDKLDKPNINITKLEQLGFNTIAHYKQDGIKMKPLYISLNVSNEELLKPVEERKKAEPKPEPKKQKDLKIIKTKFGDFKNEDDNDLIIPIFVKVLEQLKEYKFNDNSEITDKKLYKFYSDSKLPIPKKDETYTKYQAKLFDNIKKINFDNTPEFKITTDLITPESMNIIKRFTIQGVPSKILYALFNGFLLNLTSFLNITLRDIYLSTQDILKKKIIISKKMLIYIT